MSVALKSKLEDMLDAYANDGKSLPIEAGDYVRSICRRLDYMTLQRDIILAIDWGTFSNAGIFDHRVGKVACTEIDIKGSDGNSQLKICIANREFCTSIVYKAFDDIVCGAINMQDTMGRLLNEIHGMRVNERQATLGKLREEAKDACDFAKFLDQSVDYSQLRLLRDLRGKLQHSAFEHVLRLPESDWGLPGGEPRLHARIQVGQWSSDRDITRFVGLVVEAAKTLVTELATILVASPSNSVDFK